MQSSPQTERLNLLGLTRPALEAYVGGLGSKPFRARQLAHWIYKRGEARFEHMTDLAKPFRAELEGRAEVRTPEIVTVQRSRDGTRKWKLRADSTQAFEMVFIPEEDRGTLCISSQVGCALDCSFCATAQQGFNRNLSTAEIVGQVWLARRELAADGAVVRLGDLPSGDPVSGNLQTSDPLPSDPPISGRAITGAGRAITNVVLMGMGEPLANYRNVVPALQILLDDCAFDLSRRRVTLSTSGLVPQIYRLAADVSVALAVSLHAPDDALRDELVPINRRHPIAELLEACWHYLDEQNGRSVTFEYVLLDGVNDSCAQARRLARLLAGHPAKINLIPFNPFPGTRYRRSPDRQIVRFRDELLGRGLVATVRRTRGEDIDAACGQLAGRVIDRTTVRLGSRASRGTSGRTSSATAGGASSHPASRASTGPAGRISSEVLQP